MSALGCSGSFEPAAEVKLEREMRTHTIACLVGSAVVGLFSCAATADIVVPLGMGWEAVLASNNVSLTVNPSTDGVLHLSKQAVFSAVNPGTGMPEPVLITFRQVLPDNLTSSQIIIDDETLQNLTGTTWTGYRQFLSLSNNVSFGAASLGMSVGPEFTTNTLLNSNRDLLTDGGPGVANGAVWMPGAVGGLVINVNLAGQDAAVVFVLKELPLVPTPGAGALGVAGLLSMGRRRR
jgi:hypothetical protein